MKKDKGWKVIEVNQKVNRVYASAKLGLFWVRKVGPSGEPVMKKRRKKASKSESWSWGPDAVGYRGKEIAHECCVSPNFWMIILCPEPT